MNSSLIACVVLPCRASTVSMCVQSKPVLSLRSMNIKYVMFVLFLCFLAVYVLYFFTRQTSKERLVLWSLSIGFDFCPKKWCWSDCRFPGPISLLVSLYPMPIFTGSVNIFRYDSAKERKNLNVYLMKVHVVFLTCCKKARESRRSQRFCFFSSQFTF